MQKILPRILDYNAGVYLRVLLGRTIRGRPQRNRSHQVQLCALQVIQGGTVTMTGASIENLQYC